MLTQQKISGHAVDTIDCHMAFVPLQIAEDKADAAEVASKAANID